MGETDEVQEWIKANLEPMKKQMTTMMKAMMSMKKIMKVNTAVVAATSAITKVELTPTSGLNQINHAISDMVGQIGKELGSTGGPHFVQVQNKHSFPPYGLAFNHTPPNVAHTPNEDVDNSTLIPIQSQQSQADHAHVSQPMGETHEIPHHNLTDFEPCLGYVTKGQAVGGVPLPNTLEGPQIHRQPQPMHFAAGRVPLAMAEKGKWKDMVAQVVPPIMERELITMMVDTLPVSYYEKMVGYMPSSFANSVFAGERVKVGLRRGKFDCLALTSKKPGANEENEKEEGTHVLVAIPTWPNFPFAQQCHYSADINPPHYPPPNHPQRPSINQPQSPPATQPMPNTTFSTNQNTNQGRNFAAKKLVEFTPISMTYANLLPNLLDNSMVAITPAKVPQPPFFRGYYLNTTCAYRG
ncbi:hypothetical protein GmHk_13G036226 [Glycine max]|nr:hypothetical protein GmHk_13G036226 [Glycine max]